MKRPVRIANCSGFFGDRLSAATEMVEGGPIDVLTGDWLAELTMLILARQRMKHGAGSGYARTFITQMEQNLATCLDRGIKVVSNAGGLDPQGCADALREFADSNGLNVKIGVVSGDDLVPRLDQLRDAGEQFTNLDTGQRLEVAGVQLLTANAYLGGQPITKALAAGADVVIAGRVTDAALTIGPAAWWHAWDYGTEFDAIAGAIVAGHAIECGTQVTGGNYSFFTDIPQMAHPGFPIAEVAADGSSVITKHANTDGLVSVGTVTAQLLYEIGSPRYANPDATACFNTIELSQEAPDRVRISGCVGEGPPDTLKVAATHLGGMRNSMSLVLTGLQRAEKADLILNTLAGIGLADIAQPDLAKLSTLDVDELAVYFDDTAIVDPASTAQAQSHLRLVVKDADPKRIAKAFTAPVVEAALASYPGMFPTAVPGSPAPFGVYWPTTVKRRHVVPEVSIDGQELP